MALEDLSDSSSNDDDSLLSIQALQPWRYNHASPVKPKHVETSIAPSTTKRKLFKPASAISSSLFHQTPTTTASSSIAGRSTTAESSDTKQASSTRSTSASSSSTAKTTEKNKGKGRDTGSSSSLSASRESSTVPDSKNENELDTGLTEELDGLGLTLAAADAPKLKSQIFGQEWASPVKHKTPSLNATTMLAPPVLVQSKETRKVTQKRDKGRRLTIITILDSDEEAELLATKDREAPTPVLTACSTGSSSGSISPSSGENTPEEVSFADYSDKEDEVIPSDVANKEKPPILLELDSSDSDYDAANGVLSWNPSPNKTRALQPTPRKPLAAIPSRLFGDNDSIVKSKPSTTITKRRIIQSDSSEGEDSLPVLATPKPSTSKATVRPKASTSKATSKAPANPLKSPNKKISKAAFNKERDTLAQKLIQELDESVFDGQLPKELTIVWNGRLNTTAGRASWKKTTKKPANTVTFKAEIELSVKVIDSEEKLKCTLAHELCHIAAWAVEGEMKPAHGPAFKAWGRKIMSARKDITVTTKHSYEIAYKYQWQCDSSLCAKIYGRHSKSIDPTKQACGICAGRLIQLDKDGNKIAPVAGGKNGSGTPRKESEWSVFYKDAFRRVKASNVSLSMTQINKLVAEEWQALKAAKAKSAMSVSSLEQQLGGLTV